MRGNRGGGTGRAQSEVLATALLLGITIAGVSLVVAFGGTALSDSEDRISVGSAEHAMTEFDSRTSLVALGDSESQYATLPSDGAVRLSPDAGWMNVTVRNETTGDVRVQVMNVTMGRITFERGGTTLGYQGGGVWKLTGNGSTVVSAPEVHYRGTTLTLPLVTVGGERSVGGRVRVERDGGRVGKYPDATAGLTNPLRSGEVVVTVHSDYYRAWGEFFTTRFDATASYDHGNGTTEITLVVPSDDTRNVSAALVSTGTNSDVTMSGSGGFPAFTDSYNSSEGPYSTSEAENGTITTAGSFDMGGNALVEGNLRSGSSVSLQGTADVDGDVFWTSSFTASGGASYGSEEQIDGVDADNDITARVRNTVDRIKDDNDNGATAAISGQNLDYGGTDARTLTAGEYYVQGVDLDNEDLTFDTSGGEVVLAVGNDVQLDNGANISVTGGGTARVYIKDDIDIQGSSTVHVPGDESRRLWMYGTGDTDTTVTGSNSNSPRVVAAIYAPGGAGDDGDISIQHGDVFGAVAGSGDVDIQVGGAVHFDESLRSTSPFPTATDVPRLTYLHVTVNDVNVTAA